MNKKLGRLLHPGTGMYIFILLAFGIAAALFSQYILAGVQLGIAVLLLIVHLIYSGRRRKELQNYVQNITRHSTGTDGAELPFPTVLLRLTDGGIVYANRSFIRLTGLRDTLAEKYIDDVLPGFSTDWLTAGKSEYPYDVTVSDRRYRVYGTALRAGDPNDTPLGVV